VHKNLSVNSLQKYTILEVAINPSWKAFLLDIFNRDYFQALRRFVKDEYKQHTCYPNGSEIFAAFDLCPFEQTRVVILGQDPYHGPEQAHGLCFSVREGTPKPPSLQNIFTELEKSLSIEVPSSGDLTRWAQQGVLLLNATLTVRAAAAGSHQNKGWEIFTDEVIRLISDKKKNVVFMLWGSYAKKKGAHIDRSKHLVLTCGHPSPLSANRGYWFGNKHFALANDYLEKNGLQKIKW